MDWLGRSSYDHLGLYIHGVEYYKNGETINDTYMPLLFESPTDPIASSRDELGMPISYSLIEVHRKSNSCRINAGW